MLLASAKGIVFVKLYLLLWLGLQKKSIKIYLDEASLYSKTKYLLSKDFNNSNKSTNITHSKVSDLHILLSSYKATDEVARSHENTVLLKIKMPDGFEKVTF